MTGFLGVYFVRVSLELSRARVEVMIVVLSPSSRPAMTINMYWNNSLGAQCGTRDSWQSVHSDDNMNLCATFPDLTPNE